MRLVMEEEAMVVAVEEAKAIVVERALPARAAKCCCFVVSAALDIRALPLQWLHFPLVASRPLPT